MLKPLRRLNGIFYDKYYQFQVNTANTVNTANIVIGWESFDNRMSKFTSVPTTTTLSVSDSLIVVITFSVNGWMNLTSSPKMANLSFEFIIFLQTKTALPSSLVLCFICNIFIHVIYNLNGTVFRCSIQSCVLYRLLDEQLFCYVWRRPMVIRGLNIFTSIISCHTLTFLQNASYVGSLGFWMWKNGFQRNYYTVLQCVVFLEQHLFCSQ